ncbi:MAG: hypothetical protein QM820_37355, partial [Minicystis sp.]
MSRDKELAGQSLSYRPGDSSTSESHDARFLARYAALTDPKTLARELEDSALRGRVALVLETSLDELTTIAHRDGYRSLARRLRARPDLVARLVAEEASSSVGEPTPHPRFIRALQDISDDVAPSPAVLHALKDMTGELVAKYRELSGESFTLDVESFAAHGRAALVHLLHTSPRLPSFGATFAKRQRIPAARPSGAAIPPARGDVDTPPPATSPSDDEADDTTAPTTGEREDAAAARRAEIDALLGCCPNPTATPSGAKDAFPENLQGHEDIYYDFSIVVPIDGGEEPWDADADADAMNVLLGTSTTAFRALISIAKSVIDTLDAAKLAAIYGPTLIPDIKQYLQSAEQHIDDPRSWFREGLRRTSRELASALRLIARTRLHVAPGESDTLLQAMQLATQLDNAHKNFSFTRDPNRRLPKQMGAAAYGERTDLVPPIQPHDEDRGDVLWATGVTQLPDAEWMPFGPSGNSSVSRWFNWMYDWNGLPGLRQYLDGMALKYDEIKALSDLCGQAASMLAQINHEISAGNVGDAEYRRKMEQLLGGLANDAAYALATIL